MERLPVISVLWQGHPTVALTGELLQRTDRLEIDLPLDYNHTLFRRLNPGASPSSPERIDVRGGPELLSVVAGINGLEELAILIDTLREAHAAVEILSPPKLVIIPRSGS